jgi:hypothetical protein
MTWILTLNLIRIQFKHKKYDSIPIKCHDNSLILNVSESANKKNISLLNNYLK